jgi:hypothetical protein
MYKSLEFYVYGYIFNSPNPIACIFDVPVLIPAQITVISKNNILALQSFDFVYFFRRCGESVFVVRSRWLVFFPRSAIFRPQQNH